MNFKDKLIKVKALFANFDKLEKSVQAQLMDVADKLAPMVQGGGISPKAVRVPEPIEYPDIETKPVPVKKHQLETFAEQFLKSDWHPVAKTQKHPSAPIPYEEKPHYKKFVPEQANQAPVNKGDMKKDGSTLGSEINTAISQARGTSAPSAPPKLPQAAISSIQGAFGKAEMHSPRPALSPIKPPARNIPDEPKKQ